MPLQESMDTHIEQVRGFSSSACVFDLLRDLQLAVAWPLCSWWSALLYVAWSASCPISFSTTASSAAATGG